MMNETIASGTSPCDRGKQRDRPGGRDPVRHTPQPERFRRWEQAAVSQTIGHPQYLVVCNIARYSQRERRKFKVEGRIILAKKKAVSAANKSEQARQYAAANPKATTQDIATALGFTYTTVYQALHKPTKKKKAKKASAAGNGRPTGTGTGHTLNGSHKNALAAYVEWAGGVGKAIEILQVVQGAKVPF
jgi:hypothetical protein